jgi:hypothetical protein
MPDFTFEGPGGRTITITGPEGATQEQAIGILRQQHPELWDTPVPRSHTGSELGQTILHGIHGFESGVEETINKTASYLPWSKASKGIPEIPPAQDTAESFGRFAGNIAPTFAVPGFGIAGGVARAVPGALGRLAGTALQGGVQGAVGGALQPGDSGSNIKSGAEAGAGTAGALGATETALNALPPRYRWIANMAASSAATAAISHLGIPSWMHLPMWWGLYRARLADLAQQWAGRGSRVNMAPVGATATHITGDDDGR